MGPRRRGSMWYAAVLWRFMVNCFRLTSHIFCIVPTCTANMKASSIAEGLSMQDRLLESSPHRLLIGFSSVCELFKTVAVKWRCGDQDDIHLIL